MERSASAFGYINGHVSNFRPSHRRRAGLLRSLVMLLCGVGLLCGSAAVFNPATLMAISGVGTAAPVNENHRMFAETLAALIGRCHQVIAVHDRGSAPYSEVVLWVEDKQNPGVIDPEEISVISHSQLFRTVTVHSLTQCGGTDGARPARPSDFTRPTTRVIAGGSVTGARRTAASSINLGDRASLQAHSFGDTWRALPQVQRCVIAIGVSDLRFHLSEPSGTLGQGAVTENLGSHATKAAQAAETSMLEVSLTWSADSVDGAGVAASRVHVSTGGEPARTGNTRQEHRSGIVQP